MTESLQYSVENVTKCPYVSDSYKSCDEPVHERDISQLFQNTQSSQDTNDYNISQLIEMEHDYDITPSDSEYEQFSEDGLIFEDPSNLENVVQLNQPETDPIKSGFDCPTPQCSGWITIKDEAQMFAICVVCGDEICVFCQVAHGGLNCERFWQQQEIEANVETRGGYNEVSVFSFLCVLYFCVF